MSRADDQRRGTSRAGVDLDRLADYAGGALGREEAAAVAGLVETDARWAAALEAVMIADRAVGARLRELAHSEIVAMPADVVARLDDALGSIDRPAASSVSVVSLADVRATHVRATHVRATHRPTRRRLFAGITAAAATLLAVVGGIAVATQFAQRNAGSPSAAEGHPQLDSADGRGAATAAAPSPATGESGGPGFVTTGTDYHADTLRTLARTAVALGEMATAPGVTKATDAMAPPPDVREAAPLPLARLTDRIALAACLDAIRPAHPGPATLVDYARYNGQPALVVLIRAPTSSTVVVVGPSCGLAGADERTAAQIP